MALHRRQKFWKLRHAWYVPTSGTFLANTVVLTSAPETKHFIYFYLGHYAILLFKTQ
jgi:hypothetical protein